MDDTHETVLRGLRNARAGDAGALAKLMERTFRDTFGAFSTEAQMAAHCDVHYGEAIQHDEILDPAITTLVYSTGDNLLGFAQVRQGKHPVGVNGSRPIEIQRLYVDAPAHGKGVAQVLMTAALDDAAKRGADAVWLGVWEHNPKAIRFYEKVGFTTVGEHVFHVGDDAQRDLIMSRPL